MEALYISVYDDPLSLEPGTKAADLELLPAWRRAKVLAMRDTVHRAMGVRAFLMLGDMLRAHFGIEQIPEFAYGAHGKPYMKEYPDIHFNIAHCRRAAMCVVADRPVGCDIEETGRGASEGLIAKCMSPDEQAAIAQADDRGAVFASLWTRKEAVGKCIGTGLTDEMPHYLDADRLRGFDLRGEVRRDKGYALAVCLGGKEAEQ